MDEVSKALPDLVWLTELGVQGNQVTLKGKTLSPNAVATYLENLKKSPYFAEPVFKNLGREAGTAGHLRLGDDRHVHQRSSRRRRRDRRGDGGPKPAPGTAAAGKPGA